VPKSFLFEKLNDTMPFFEVLFKALCQNVLVKFFFVLRNADFFKFKNASELS